MEPKAIGQPGARAEAPPPFAGGPLAPPPGLVATRQDPLLNQQSPPDIDAVGDIDVEGRGVGYVDDTDNLDEDFDRVSLEDTGFDDGGRGEGRECGGRERQQQGTDRDTDDNSLQLNALKDLANTKVLVPYVFYIVDNEKKPLNLIVVG